MTKKICPKCKWEWFPRVEKPARCPRCGKWLKALIVMLFAMFIVSNASAYFDYCQNCNPQDKTIAKAQADETQKNIDNSQAIINQTLNNTSVDAVNNTLQSQNDALNKILAQEDKLDKQAIDIERRGY